MFRNYLTIAIRNLLRYKLYSLINVSGLAIGMACAFLILGFVRFEQTYDAHHQDADRIYRIIRQVRDEPGGYTETRVNTGAPLLPLIEDGLPGIEHAARLYENSGIVRTEDSGFVEYRFFFADPAIFQVFTLPLLQGNPETALTEPFSVLLTPAKARKYFGDRNPLGEILHFKKQTFKVTGILEELPGNSHFHVNFLASFESLRAIERPRFFSHWDTRTWTYVKLHEGYLPEALAPALKAIANTHLDKSSADWVGLELQPIKSIHFHRGSAGIEMGKTGSISTLYTLSTLSGVILLIACINFMNLSTARSANRARFSNTDA